MSGNNLTTPFFDAATEQQPTNAAQQNNQLISFSGEGLGALQRLFLDNSQLTSFNGEGLGALTSLNLTLDNSRADANCLAEKSEILTVWRKDKSSDILSNVPKDAIFTYDKLNYAVTCPISLDVMRHPVKVTTFDESKKKYVHVFDSEFLYRWILSSQQMINPLNRLPFTSDNIEYFQELKDYINTLATKESSGLKQKASPDTYCGFEQGFINARGSKLGLF